MKPTVQGPKFISLFAFTSWRSVWKRGFLTSPFLFELLSFQYFEENNGYIYKVVLFDCQDRKSVPLFLFKITVLQTSAVLDEKNKQKIPMLTVACEAEPSVQAAKQLLRQTESSLSNKKQEALSSFLEFCFFFFLSPWNMVDCCCC